MCVDYPAGVHKYHTFDRVISCHGTGHDAAQSSGYHLAIPIYHSNCRTINLISRLRLTNLRVGAPHLQPSSINVMSAKTDITNQYVYVEQS